MEPRLTRKESKMTYRLKPCVLSQELGGETVLLQLETEQYHQLDSIGTDMLAFLQKHSTAESVALLKERYDVPESRLRQDIEDFIEGMTSRGLLEVA